MSQDIELPNSPVTGNDCVTIFDRFKSSDIVRLYRQQEDVDVSGFFGSGETVYLLECGDTGYRFYYPFECVGDEAFYQALAGERAKKGIDYDRDWSPDHDFALAAIGPDERVLEIGCNTGKFLEGIAVKTKNVSGLEFNPVAVEAARKKGLNVRNLEIEKLAAADPESFDAICAFQVLEHIPNVKPFLQACLKALKPGGKLIFSVPNNQPYFQRFSKYEVLNLPPHHMGLWNLKAFQKLENFFAVSLEKHKYTGTSGLLADAYLRSKFMAGSKLPKANPRAFLLLPFAVVMSLIDLFRKKVNAAYVSVVLTKER
jgi:2-polyprenyl-3-methyl-5-hydroxy-6-metoxy-1,4-benzoquinol methylase